MTWSFIGEGNAFMQDDVPIEELTARAMRIVEASRRLDYARIIAHDPAEVQKLQAVLAELEIAPVDLAVFEGPSGLTAPADSNEPAAVPVPREPRRIHSRQSSSVPLEERPAASARRRQVIETLNREGLTARLGKIYDSTSAERVKALRKVPHRRGLPAFDMVVAPDFSPLAGLHGIFICPQEVVSAALPGGTGAEQDWRVISRKPFTNHKQLVACITLMSAGFDTP